MVAARLDRAIQVLVPVLAFLLPVSRRGVTIVASLVLLLWLLRGGWRERWRTVRSSPLLLAILAFVVLGVTSLAWSTDVLGGLDYLSKYRYFLLAAVVATSCPSGSVGRVLDAFLAGIAVSLVWSFGIAAGLVHFGHGYPENPAPSMNHLDYSMFLAVAGLVILVHLVRRPAGGWRRAGWAALAVATVVGLLVNIGRSGQLAFFVALAALLARRLPGPRFLRPVVAAAAAATLLSVAYLTVPTFRSRAVAALHEIEGAVLRHEYGTNQGKRVASMIASAELMRAHPVVGTGVGDAVDDFQRTVQQRYPDLAEAVRAYRHLHNQYLQVGVELGLLGLAALLNIFVQLLRAATGRPELDDVARVVGWVFLVGCVGDPFLHKQLPLILFSLMCGLVVAGGRPGGDGLCTPSSPGASSDPPTRPEGMP